MHAQAPDADHDLPGGGGGLTHAETIQARQSAHVAEVRLRSPARVAAKRVVDLVVGTVLAVATLPIVLLLAAWSAAQFRTWPFFVQDRMGHHGHHFPFVKIRTLPRGWGAYTLKHEMDQSTIPWVSRHMRRLHLDELPQLWLVPIGKMSLVGPRPKMPDEFEPVDAVYGYLRTRVPQGCTGLWQVSEHQHELPSDTPQYAFFYLQYGGLRLDMWILLRTALQMMGIARPVRLDSVPDWARGRGWITGAPATNEIA